MLQHEQLPALQPFGGYHDVFTPRPDLTSLPLYLPAAFDNQRLLRQDAPYQVPAQIMAEMMRWLQPTTTQEGVQMRMTPLGLLVDGPMLRTEREYYHQSPQRRERALVLPVPSDTSFVPQALLRGFYHQTISQQWQQITSTETYRPTHHIQEMLLDWLVRATQLMTSAYPGDLGMVSWASKVDEIMAEAIVDTVDGILPPHAGDQWIHGSGLPGTIPDEDPRIQYLRAELWVQSGTNGSRIRFRRKNPPKPSRPAHSAPSTTSYQVVSEATNDPWLEIEEVET